MYHDIDQNSPEWFELRKGKFTCSTFKNPFLQPSTLTYQKEISRVVFERMTGKSPEGFTSEWMERGKELESMARNYYEAEKLEVVKNGGIYVVDEWTAGSPDGLIGDDGLLEIKCPAPHTMIDYLKTKKIPKDYIIQMQGQMFISGRKWCDFMAFHPDLPIHIIRCIRILQRSYFFKKKFFSLKPFS